MKKATSALIAAVATLALSGGAYAQATGGSAGGGSSHGSTSSPAPNQMNDSSNSYGTPGMTNSDSGMPNPAMQQQGPNNTSTPAPKTNNTLATPSVKSPADNQ
ncbi:hypothetical protein [Paraburkholderia sp. C35]|uniref:hypothetical protein n=1 Tax=Paraburkholderia sp. C35 TaxID=2126993 RepID=UPI000D6961C4|nr:hypothetical protein [Paraburkholderia sp. C35]